MTEQDARDAAQIAALTWPPADAARLAALVAIGPPSQLHAAGPCVPETREGGVLRGTSDRAAYVRGTVLAMWREVSGHAGVPLPKPGAP